MSRFISLLALVLAMWLTACGPGSEADISGGPGLAGTVTEGPMIDFSATELPEYHQPLDWWRNNHPLLVDRKHGRGERFFRQGECLACHVPRSFCMVCHNYVGAPGVEGAE